MGGISVLILMGVLSFAFWTFIAMFLLIIIYGIICYIFESIAIMSISKNFKYKAPATAWIPFYNKYLLGKIVENKTLGVILALLNLGAMAIGAYCYSQIELNLVTFILFLVCTIVGFILDIVISHKIYANITTRYGDVLTVLSVLSLGLLRPIILFIIRNKVQNKNNKTMEIR